MKSIQNANWEDIREKRDEAFAKVLGESLESARFGIEKAETKIGESTSAVEQKAEKALSKGKSKAVTKASEIKEEVPAKVEQIQTDASRSSAGTVDAARAAVRGAVSKGIEKGKQLVGKAQDAVGAVAESKDLGTKSEVERALDERYHPTSAPLDVSPEEALAERYKSTT